MAGVPTVTPMVAPPPIIFIPHAPMPAAPSNHRDMQIGQDYTASTQLPEPPMTYEQVVARQSGIFFGIALLVVVIVLIINGVEHENRRP